MKNSELFLYPMYDPGAFTSLLNIEKVPRFTLHDIHRECTHSQPGPSEATYIEQNQLKFHPNCLGSGDRILEYRKS